MKKITGIELFQVDLPYAGGVYRLCGGRTYSTLDATIAIRSFLSVPGDRLLRVVERCRHDLGGR